MRARSTATNADMTEDASKPLPSSLTRAQLYDLVWAEPLNRIAQRLGTTAQKLSQLCDKHAIARPDQGHWLRIEMGKPVQIHPLQPPPAGVADAIVIVPATPRKLAAHDAAEPYTAAGVRPKPVVEVPERLVRPHALVAEWVATRERQVRAREQVYDPRLKRLVMPVPLTPADRRRLLVANAIFKAVEKKGVDVRKGERRDLLMVLGGERIEFQLRYRLKRGQRPLTPDELRWRAADTQKWTYELYETDSLVFEIKTWLPNRARTEWEDSKRGTIEAQLGEIVDSILAAFPALEELRRQREEERRRHELEARRRSELEAERKLDQARFRRLLEHVAQWREAEVARAFLAALRTAMPADAAAVAGVEIDDWFAWAERKVEEHDRLTSDPRSVLESIAEVTNWTYRDV